MHAPPAGPKTVAAKFELHPVKYNGDKDISLEKSVYHSRNINDLQYSWKTTNANISQPFQLQITSC